VRAVIALGGLQDRVVIYTDVPPAAIRVTAVDAATRALLPGERAHACE
jgi:hypothetical protein